jgi:hypothetical protein
MTQSLEEFKRSSTDFVSYTKFVHYCWYLLVNITYFFSRHICENFADEFNSLKLKYFSCGSEEGGNWTAQLFTNSWKFKILPTSHA